jgi:peptidoglycan/xylan/chitin deacetylase (PgdA/CDA1 family)
MLANIIRRVSSGTQHVYLTFDDGPDPDYTPRVLDALGAAGVPATFFVVGVSAVRHAALIRRMLAEGHEVANHTWSHPHPRLVSARVARHEVTAATDALADILGQRPRYFRPPFGHLRRNMTEAAQGQGQAVVLWSVSGLDWGPRGRAALIVKRLMHIRRGDIILLHDAPWRYNRPWETLKVLSGLLPRLETDGLKLGLLGSEAPAPALSQHAAAALS